MNVTIRNELPADYRRAEEVTREAFWNLYVPGCDEPYMLHVMRSHPDCIPALAFVAIFEETMVGNILYARSHLRDEAGQTLPTLSFGPVSVLPEYQHKG